MGDAPTTARKAQLRRQLFRIGVETIRSAGWTVERIPGSGKASLRRITKDGQSKKVSIRTTQDTWLAFLRDRGDTHWVTLSEVDAVVAVSVDDPAAPRMAQVHLLDADDVRARFDRAYRARLAAGYQLPSGRGMWLSLYREEADDPVVNVGAGVGLASAPIARVPLPEEALPAAHNGDGAQAGSAPRSRKRGSGVAAQPVPEPALTIPEAKRRLAQALSVDPASIKITVEA